ncbi:hypothetical protein SAMN05216480_104200 [Pustulibacterium marinum]|uniref:Uncharacterized protein n=1 Tax=Pustulibacterium marinum TaxID=1224947 RepID=A0A1I7GGA3_9FLAO|nr:hypothetical protein [Pustulibacterium marinum]SFU47517.1 hypothetical protein SAMN05216480_104200 [Pustulibacterium marinum]
MSENRRNRRKIERNKRMVKNVITVKDKVIGLFVMVLIFVIAVVAAYYFSFLNAGIELF